MIWVIIAIILVSILILFLLLHLKIRIQYDFHQAAHELTIYVYLIRIKVFQKKIDLRKNVQHEYNALFEMLKDFNGEGSLKGIKQIITDIIDQLKIAKKTLLFLLKNITFQQLAWKTYFGTGEASSTGIASGGFWMVKGTLIGTIYELSNMHCQPKINVVPYFQQKGFRTEIDCIITIRIGKAIHTAMHIMRNFSSTEEVYS